LQLSEVGMTVLTGTIGNAKMATHAFFSPTLFDPCGWGSANARLDQPRIDMGNAPSGRFGA
jgi:hypothetical protein